MAHDNHRDGAGQSLRKLGFVAAVNFGGFVIELAGGVGILLVPMVGVLLFESYQRYLSPVEINTRMTITRRFITVHVRVVYCQKDSDGETPPRAFVRQSNGHFGVAGHGPGRHSRGPGQRPKKQYLLRCCTNGDVCIGSPC